MAPLIPVLYVALGGALGSVARFLLSGWVGSTNLGAKFPLGTCSVNLAGCLLIGVLAGLSERYPGITPEGRLFLFTGILGGFTTFSTFGLETVDLMRNQQGVGAAVYVTVSVVGGLAAVWIGIRLASA